MACNIAMILLAAGLSRRSGSTNKLLALVDGAPMLLSAVEAALQSTCASVVVVTGHEAERVKKVLAGRDVTFVHNKDYEEGMASSIRTGIGALTDDVEGVLIGLGDMPHIRPQTFAALIDAFAPDQGHEICVPTYDGRPGNPVLFGKQFFPALEQVTGDTGGKAVIQKNRLLVIEVPVNDPGIHLDHDVV